MFHLPRAWQEASAEPCGFQKESPPARAAGAGWCGHCATPPSGTGRLFQCSQPPILQEGVGFEQSSEWIRAQYSL